ncbi:MAG: HD domain-containing protein [Lachnospiraceae bacterium]|nr:HD domain-containing protein [Lachnospiraceae bacterium]
MVLTATAPVCAFAEEHEIAVDPTGSTEGYSAILYDNTDGLPTSESNTIAETEEGFIWIGSYSGLIRYDGANFERIDSVSTGIANVISLYVDDQNRLWVGTNDSGLVMKDGGRYISFNKEDGLNAPMVRSIAGDPRGNIYVGTAHGVNIVDEEMNLTGIDDPRIYDQYIRNMKTGSDGTVYGLTWDGDVFTLKDKKLTGYYSTKKMGVENVISINPDPDEPGYVYLGTEKSEIVHGNLADGFAKKERIDVSPLGYVNSINEIGGDFWVCADNGIGKAHNGRFVTLDNIPLTNSIEHMLVDYEGNMWFTSSRQGVMKIVPNRFSDVFERYNLESRVVNSTCEQGNRLYIATDTGLAVLEDNRVLESVPIKSARTASGKDLGASDLFDILGECRIRSVIEDKNNDLWFSTYSDNCLVRLHDGDVTCFRMDDGMPSDRVRACYETDEGLILASCSAGGVAVIEGDRVKDVYMNGETIGTSDVLTICQDFDGNTVLGTDGDGIYIMNGSNVMNINTDSGLNSGVVMRIKRSTTRKVLWIVTSNSLAFMDEDHKVTTIKNFPYSNNFDIFENSKGEMWILSSNGVYVISVDAVLRNGELSPVYYGRENGLPCIATANSYSELTEDGDLYISGTTKVAKVNIEKVFENVSNVKMAVPFVEEDGKTYYPDENGVIKLPSGGKKLTVHAFVYTYSMMNPLVTYYLDGFDENAVTVERKNLVPIDYTNLNGGNYRFVMKVKDPLGNSESELFVNIVKEKAVYETVWFRLLVALLVILIISAFVRLYIKDKTKKLEKKQEENRLFIREMTEAFAKTIDMKDKYTNGHSRRVAEYTAMLARELGCDEEEIEKYYNIALLHDIGKIGVPPEVLNKPGQLTDEEFQIIKSHSALGYNVLKDIEVMPDLAIGAGSHHERPDGKGYPKGLSGDEIPRVAQIIAVADTFDAMYSDRPYRKRMNFEKAVSIIKDAAGTQLEKDVVEAFLRLVDQGKMRAPDDDGGGTTEDIDNIHKNYKKTEA